MTPPATAALYYHPEAYSMNGPRLMGRNAAGESFLRAFFKHHKSSPLWAQVQSRDHGQAFEDAAQAADRKDAVRLIGNNNLQALAEPGCLYLPGPNLVDAAWSRSFYGHANWSLCGITHTTASAAAMDAIASLLIGPVQPWDALICTSPTVKANVERILQAQADYLQERLSIQRLVLPQLPVIPLGLHCRDFAFSPKQIAKARAELGLDQQTVVVLFAGRLSFHAKAHPLAMYQALQAAKEALPKGQKLLLLELGWFGNAPIERAFQDAARWAAPDVDVRHLDGRQEENRQRAWAAANVFCSLSDNLQETFGITPIEAMATGLPTVVSDWDGYRGTVEHGVTGFRVPSAMPEAGQALGLDLAKRHALGIDTYDMYCGLTSSMVSIDIAATTQAFKQLFASETLRRSMGEAGRQRALQLYEWSVVMKQYEALWKGLSEIRQAAQPAALKPLGNWPARQDPFHIFAGYPSLPFNMNTGLRRRHASLQESLQFYTEAMALAMVSFARPAMPSDTELQTLIKAADQEQSVQDLLAHLPEERQALGLRGLAWLLKLGVFERAGSKPLG